MAERMDKIPELKFWCQKVLPAIYDDSLSYYELLDKVVKSLNDTIEVVNEAVTGIDGAIEDASYAKEVADDAKEIADDAKENADEAIQVATDAQELISSVVYNPGTITDDCTWNSDTSKVVISNKFVGVQGCVVWFSFQFVPKATTSTLALELVSGLPKRIGSGVPLYGFYEAYNVDNTSERIVCALGDSVGMLTSDITCRISAGNVDETYCISGCYMCKPM